MNVSCKNTSNCIYAKYMALALDTITRWHYYIHTCSSIIFVVTVLWDALLRELANKSCCSLNFPNWILLLWQRAPWGRGSRAWDYLQALCDRFSSKICSANEIVVLKKQPRSLSQTWWHNFSLNLICGSVCVRGSWFVCLLTQVCVLVDVTCISTKPNSWCWMQGFTSDFLELSIRV